MSDLPVGAITSLFTDVEGSTRLRRQRPGRMGAARAAQLFLLRDPWRKVRAHA